MTAIQPLPFRSRLRAATRDLIAAGMPVFRGQVFNDRHIALRLDQLPAVRIYTHEEARQSVQPAHQIGYYSGTVNLAVQIVMQGAADSALADRLDQLCFAVEVLLFSSPDWKCGAGEGTDSVTTIIDGDDTTQVRLSTATITFGIRYAEYIPVVIPDDFRTLLINWDLIDPAADPNTGPPGTPPNVEGGYHGGYPGPDGRIEVQQVFDVSSPHPEPNPQE